MSDLTAPECEKNCKLPHTCCSIEYCLITIDHAKKEWGVDLETTGNEKLPLMGPTGCTAAPHLRPICTVHTCDINNLGFKRGDPAWTEQYFKLRGKIEELYCKVFYPSEG